MSQRIDGEPDAKVTALPAYSPLGSKKRAGDQNNARRQHLNRTRKKLGLRPVQIQVELNEALIIQLLIELDLLESDLPEIKEKLQTQLAKLIEYMLVTSHEDTMRDFYAKEFFNMVRFVALEGRRGDDPEVWAAFLNSEFSLQAKAKNLVREIWRSKCRQQTRPTSKMRNKR